MYIAKLGSVIEGAFLFIGSWRRGGQTGRPEITESSMWTNVSPVKMLKLCSSFSFCTDRVEGDLNSAFPILYLSKGEMAIM